MTGWRRGVDSDLSTIERALRIAREGEVTSLEQIRRQLVKDGFDNVIGHLRGTAIKPQLTAAMTIGDERGKQSGTYDGS